MMDTWLVVDLRHNRFAAGLLTMRQDRPQWNPEPVLTDIMPEANDSKAEIDLSFYREPNEKRWRSILSAGLPNLSEQYETIPALFDQPGETLPDLLPRTLGVLLGKLPKRYWDSEPLVLLDRSCVQEPVQELLRKVSRKARAIVVPGLDGLAGFALLEHRQNALPDEGALYACRVQSSPDKLEGWRYGWVKNRFRVEPVDPELVSDAPIWESLAEMERVGAALFALAWYDRILEPVRREREALRQESETKKQLLERMRGLYQRLTAVDSSSLPNPGACA